MGLSHGTNISTNRLMLQLDGANLRSHIPGSTSWIDLAPNNYVGELLNGATYNNISAGTIVFDGVDDFIEFGDFLDLGTNDLTINVWANLTTKPVDTHFLSKSFQDTGDYRFSVGIDAFGGGGLHAFIRGNTLDDGIYVVGSTNVPLNTWFMSTFVFDRSSDVKIYYNGVLETLSFPIGGTAGISMWDGLDFQSNHPLRVGTYTQADNTSPTGLMDGKLGIVQIYFKTLTNAEIVKNYKAMKHRFI